MAGVSFELRRLARQDNLLGPLQAYLHSAVISVGPWIFTVIAISIISVLSEQLASEMALRQFKLILIYNFAFSLPLSGPVCVIATRFLADSIHSKDLSVVPGVLVGSLSLLFGILFPITCWFYLVCLSLPLSLALCAIVNFLIISGIWLTNVFLSAVKDYATIMWVFIFGLIVSVLAAWWGVSNHDAFGILAGFSVGLTIILFASFAKILAEYPYSLKEPLSFLSYFKKYWELAVGGLVFNAAIWVDKWIMWFAPQSEKLQEGFISYPTYDSAMFLANLTVIPVMAAFIFSIETDFFEKHTGFYSSIRNHGSLKKIKEGHRQILTSILGAGRNFLVLQGSICMIIILSAPKIFDSFGFSFLQMGIFRIGVLGSLFLVLTLFLTVFLAYFDCRTRMLFIQSLLLISNALFTLISMHMGYAYYGYGFFFASLLSFTVAVIILAKYVVDLPYHTFITKNPSVMSA